MAWTREQMAARAANAWSLLPAIWLWRAVWAPYSLVSDSRFPETEIAAGTGMALPREHIALDRIGLAVSYFIPCQSMQDDH